MKTVNPRWTRIQELFNQAADLPLAERSGFLERECGNDMALRKELEELLATDAGPPAGPLSGIRASVLTQAISLSLDKVHRDHRAALVGTVVGAYRLTSILGHGGAGTVYLGERADRQYSARVAVKVLEQTLHEDIAHRFQAERQILANLSHPHIARLFDAGETDGGQPYLVMEYVHGEPIDRYCDKQKLGIRQRLELFLKVCTAVQYAHQNLIVHRDLKPGNILVTPDGAPKLLDFGIAKLLLDTQSNKPAADMNSQPLTRMNDRVLTPEYASPEQILGQNITTTSDVYALGIVLYELLTGTRPYQVNVISQLELERIICILDPPWPTQMLQKVRDGAHLNLDLNAVAEARGLSARRLRHELQGDLDAIVMRALRKEAEQRYNSVEQLVDDLERYLSDAPVLARQGNWIYYSRRFISRHWIGVSASAFVIVTLAATAVALTFQNRRIAEQRDLAEQENQRAEAVSSFMLEVFSSSDPFESQGKQVTAKELLDKAGTRINDDLNQQPAVRARLMAAIGKAYQRQSQPELAIKYLQDALQLLRSQPNTPAEVRAGTLDALANAHRDAGNMQLATNSLLEAMDALTAVKQQHTAMYLQLLTDIARTKQRESKTDESEQYLLKALDLSHDLYGNAHPETAAVLAALGQIKIWQGDTARAIALMREAVAICHATLSENHPDRVSADLELAYLLSRQGNYDEAYAITMDVLKKQKLLYGDNNIRVAKTMDMLSTLSQRKLNWDAAEQYSREALRITMASLGPNTLTTADLQTGLSELLIGRHRYVEAEVELHKALSFLQTPNNPNQEFTASAEYMLANVMAHTGRQKEAIDLLNINIRHWRDTHAPDWFAARSQNLLGWILWQRKHDNDARQLLLESFETLTATNSGATPAMIADARARTEPVMNSLSGKTLH